MWVQTLHLRGAASGNLSGQAAGWFQRWSTKAGVRERTQQDGSDFLVGRNFHTKQLREYGVAAFSFVIPDSFQVQMGRCRALVLGVTLRERLASGVSEGGLHSRRLVSVSPFLSPAAQLTWGGVLLPQVCGFP